MSLEPDRRLDELYLDPSSFLFIYSAYVAQETNMTFPYERIGLEHAGTFLCSQEEDKYVLKLDHKTLVSGSPTSVLPNVIVNFLFHTHPIGSKEKYKYHLDVPSSPDFAALLRSRNFLRLSIVFNSDGLVWFCFISRQFTDYINRLSLDDQKNLIDYLRIEYQKIMENIIYDENKTYQDFINTFDKFTFQNYRCIEMKALHISYFSANSKPSIRIRDIIFQQQQQELLEQQQQQLQLQQLDQQLEELEQQLAE